MSDHNFRTGVTCPVCGEGVLTHQIGTNDVEYGGQRRGLDLHYSTCDYCGSDIAEDADTKQNKRLMIAFKKEVDGLLSGAEIRRFRESFCLKQDVCAELFGGGAVAFSRYENDEVMQSSQMDRLLRLCIVSPMNISRLAAMAGVRLSPETTKAIEFCNEKNLMEVIASAYSEFEVSFGKWAKRQPNTNECHLTTEGFDPFASANDANYQWVAGLG